MGTPPGARSGGCGAPSPVPGGQTGVEGVPSSAGATTRMKSNVPVYYFEILEEEEEKEEEGKDKEEEEEEVPGSPKALHPHPCPGVPGLWGSTGAPRAPPGSDSQNIPSPSCPVFPGFSRVVKPVRGETLPIP